MPNKEQPEKITLADFLQLVDRESELEDLLETASPEIRYIDYLRAITSHVGYAQARLNDAASRLANMVARRNFDPDPALLEQGYHQVQFYIFAVAATPQAIHDFLDKNTPPLFHALDSALARGLRKSMYQSIDRWKLAPATLLMMSLRHYSQHGHLFLGQIDVQARTSHHPKGAGISGSFGFSEAVWDEVVGSVPRAQRKRVRSFFNREVKPDSDLLDPRPKQKRRIGLNPAVEAYRRACNSLRKSLEREVGGMPALKRQEIRTLQRELAEVRRRTNSVQVQTD